MHGFEDLKKESHILHEKTMIKNVGLFRRRKYIKRTKWIKGFNWFLSRTQILIMNRYSLLGILNSRKYESNVKREIEIFERKMGISIPPVYKIFYESFEVGEDSLLQIEYYKDPEAENGKTLLFRGMDFSPKPNFFPPIDYFFDLNAIQVVLDNYSHEDFILEKLLPIVKMSNDIVVAVSYENDTQDQIIVVNTFLDKNEGKHSIIADNIFHFLRGVEIFDEDSEAFIYNKLYQNWNEDFWRIREEP